jgi:hypothetical protein
MTYLIKVKRLSLVGEWMVQANRDQAQTVSPDKKEETETVEEEPSEPKGDPEIAPIYVKQLLPVFTHVFTCTMLPSVRLVQPPGLNVLSSSSPQIECAKFFIPAD